MKISKKDQLIFEAMDAGFQKFEAEAFYHCLKRFKTKAQEEAAAAEREECAKVCDRNAEEFKEMRVWADDFANELGRAIRARGQE